jgi:transcriptional regulator
VLDLRGRRFESGRAAPWQLALTPDRLAAMVDAIVGFKMRVTRIDAKLKLSQNRSPEDRRRVAAGLAAEGYGEAAATAEWMRAVNEPK